jgi:SAM-dependent methyltransferase
MRENVDARTVEGFGDEWSRFDQSRLSERELSEQFDRYFTVFPWERLPADAVGFDLGCGSGRWAKLAAARVGTLHCIDASEAALAVAQKNLSGLENVRIHHASVASIPLEDGSMDFGYSLGVLHHVPDTAGGLRACIQKLKPGAPFLVYLYYAFDNRPLWFRALWKLSDMLRRAIAAMPFRAKRAVSDVIAIFVYLPAATASKLLERVGFDVANLPLSTYRRHSFYTMRTDALDRFGTRLEKRFSRHDVRELMSEAGLGDIRFSEQEPYWCAVGYRK